MFEILEEKDKLIQKQFERIDLLKHRIKLMGISFSKQRKLDKECLSAKLDAKLDRIDIKLKNSTLRVKLVSHTYGYPILLHMIEVIDQHSMLLKEMNKTKITQLELIELSTSFNCRNKYSIDRLSCLELIEELINEQASVIDTVTAQIFSKSQHQCIKALEYDAGSVTNRRALMNKYVLLYTEALNKHAEQIDRIRHKLEIKSITE